jgi:hypothetical protein
MTQQQQQAVHALAHPPHLHWGAVIGGAFVAACVFYTLLHVLWWLVPHLRRGRRDRSGKG